MGKPKLILPFKEVPTMPANYATYSDLFNSLYTGTALTDLRMSDNVEIVRRYLVDNGAGTIAQHLGIGIRVFERDIEFDGLYEEVTA